MGGNKNVYKVCERTVAKSAHALRCSHCKLWVHVDYEKLVEEDFFFFYEEYVQAWFLLVL